MNIRTISNASLGACLCVMAQLSTPVAVAAEIGNPGEGLTYARQACASCHAVAAGKHDSPNAKATSFQRVAESPGFTRTALTVFFRTPHPNMPNLVITGDDADNVIAYILSLKKPTN